MQSEIMRDAREAEGAVLKRLREGRGLSMEHVAQQMAQEVHPSWTPQAVVEVETGVNGLSSWDHVEYCKVLGVDPQKAREQAWDECQLRREAGHV